MRWTNPTQEKKSKTDNAQLASDDPALSHGWPGPLFLRGSFRSTLMEPLGSINWISHERQAKEERHERHVTTTSGSEEEGKQNISKSIATLQLADIGYKHPFLSFPTDHHLYNCHKKKPGPELIVELKTRQQLFDRSQRLGWWTAKTSIIIIIRIDCKKNEIIVKRERRLSDGEALQIFKKPLTAYPCRI